MPTRLLLEGPEIEPLLAQVHEDYGSGVRIISADKVRTGGFAGFFAKQRYELSVEVPDAPPPGPAAARPGPGGPVDNLLDLLEAREADLLPQPKPVKRTRKVTAAVPEPPVYQEPPEPPEPPPTPVARPATPVGATPRAALVSTASAAFAEVMAEVSGKLGAESVNPEAPVFPPASPAPGSVNGGAPGPAEPPRHAAPTATEPPPYGGQFPVPPAAYAPPTEQPFPAGVPHPISGAAPYVPPGAPSGWAPDGIAYPQPGLAAPLGMPYPTPPPSAVPTAAPVDQWLATGQFSPGQFSATGQVPTMTQMMPQMIPPLAASPEQWQMAAAGTDQAAAPPTAPPPVPPLRPAVPGANPTAYVPPLVEPVPAGAMAEPSLAPGPIPTLVPEAQAAPAPVAPPTPVVAPTPVAAPAPAARPAGEPVPAPIVQRLLDVGVPVGLAGKAAGATDPYQAVLSVVSDLPAPPRTPTSAGDILVIAGELGPAMALAAQVASSLHMDPTKIIIAGTPLPAHATGNADQASRRVTSPQDARKIARRLQVGEVPAIVVLDAPVQATDSGWIRSMCNGFGATAVWAAVDATRKTSETARHVRALGRIDAIGVYGAGTCADPASVLALGVPVAVLDGQPANPHAWAALLSPHLYPTAGG